MILSKYEIIIKSRQFASLDKFVITINGLNKSFEDKYSQNEQYKDVFDKEYVDFYDIIYKDNQHFLQSEVVLLMVDKLV